MGADVHGGGQEIARGRESWRIQRLSSPISTALFGMGTAFGGGAGRCWGSGKFYCSRSYSPPFSTQAVQKR